MTKAKEEVKEEVVEAKDQIATKEDINGLRDAISELTKAVGDLTAENVKWYRAGKMTLLMCLTLSVFSSILV